MIRKSSLIPAAVLLLASAVPPAQGAAFFPTKLSDSADGACDSDCSLREAVVAANAADGPDVIVLAAGMYELNLAGAGEDLGATGDLDVRDDLSIVGRDTANTILYAGSIDRVLDVLAGVRLELVGVTLLAGAVSAPGGGIRVLGELDLTRALMQANVADAGGGIAGIGAASRLNVVQSSILYNHSTGDGGGLYVEGALTLVNSTLSSNFAQDLGGGLHAHEDAQGTVSNTTIASNTAESGGGVFAAGGLLSFENTIIAANSSSGFPDTERDCLGAASSAGHNLLGDGSGCPDFRAPLGDLEGTAAEPLEPKLLPFLATGGPTPVHRPDTGSPAIDHGAGCEPVDQKGAARSLLGCEIGAVEVTDQCVSGGHVLCLNQSRFQVQVTWTTAAQSGPGLGTQLTHESGYFFFFNPLNAELTVKVLNGCDLGGHYWVFLSGLTNVGVDVTVTDTQTGLVKTYHSPLNQSFLPVLDTSAFACS